MTDQLPETPMTVVRLDVDSFKRLHAVHVVPDATGLVPVRGKNGAGKSSLIESMLAALHGKAGRVDLPIMEGEHGAQVVVDLGELIVKRRWTRDSGGKAKTTLTVETADGVPQKGPQAVLDSLVGKFADPVAFLEAPAADQVKTVLHVLGLDDELQALEDQAEGWYDQRRVLGRDADRSAKAVAELELEVDGLPAPPTEGSVEELATQLQQAKDTNATLEASRTTMDSAKARGTEAGQRLKRLQAETALLEQEIEVQRTAWKAAAEFVKKGTPVDLAPIVDALTSHEDAAKHAGRRELLDSMRHQDVETQKVHATAEENLGLVRRKIADLLDGAEFPVEGMHYDATAKVITIGGIPFSQASQAERLKAAAAVAMAGSPRIRVMFVREGSLLDDESMAQLAALASDNGFQCWCERVDSNPEGAGIWIEDGEASQGGA